MSVKPIFKRLHDKPRLINKLNLKLICNFNTPLDVKPESPLFKQGGYSQPIMILPGIYLGDINNANNIEILSKCNIGYVINVAKELNNVYEKTSIKTIKLPWDHNQEDIMVNFDSAFDFVEEALNSNVNVLIHCHCGISRSASLVIAYVMKSRGYNFETAYMFVKNISPCISPNLSLLSQLLEFEKRI